MQLNFWFDAYWLYCVGIIGYGGSTLSAKEGNCAEEQSLDYTNFSGNPFLLIFFRDMNFSKVYCIIVPSCFIHVIDLLPVNKKELEAHLN